jgi:5-carboxymethyl-2-hydroxymuconate isomerase
MPQAIVEYSGNVADRFDALGFVRALHENLVDLTGTDLESCKTRLVELKDVVIGDGSPGNAMIHVDIGILAGRSQRQKTDLGKATLAAALSHLREWQVGNLQLTVAVNDIDAGNYHKVVVTNHSA